MVNDQAAKLTEEERDAREAELLAVISSLQDQIKEKDIELSRR